MLLNRVSLVLALVLCVNLAVVMADDCTEFAGTGYTIVVVELGDCLPICLEKGYSSGRHPEPPLNTRRPMLGVCCCKA